MVSVNRIIIIGNLLGTFFCTEAAGDTFFHIHITGMLFQCDRETAFLTENFRYLGQG